MHPILVRIGPVTLYTYGLMMMVAFAATTWLATRDARTRGLTQLGITPEQVIDGCCYVLLGGLIGGRLLYVALHWDEFAPAPAEVFAIWRGGLVWYGGFLGGIVVAWLYLRSKRLDVMRILDWFMPYVALGHALGRVGCFLNGCCYGRPTDAWCGVLFPGHDTRVLPTQLFEAAGLVFLYIALRRLQRTPLGAHRGGIVGAYLIGYALLRFVIEGLRGDQTVFWAGLTLQQLISLGLLVSGLLLLNLNRKKGLSPGWGSR